MALPSPSIPGSSTNPVDEHTENGTDAQAPTAHHSEDDVSETIPVEKNVFYNQETLKYMRIIDKYKRLGVAEIELPRLVIAGAQSSGKSSLLENLTGLPVPITQGMGTRFPIEINLIEDRDNFQITASVIQSNRDGKLDEADINRLRRIYNQPMTQTQFEDLLREASLVFSVPAPVFARSQQPGATQSVPASKQISNHTLQIEMRGPEFKSLSFVDTPGLFESGNQHQEATSVADIENLVESLVAEKRTVIVAVMDARQDTIQQKIFSFVDDVDPVGERTIGVLTKCDLVPASEKDIDAYESAIKRAKNQDRVLKHGWYMVKNRLSSEARSKMSLETARTNEAKLFQSNEWVSTRTGIQRNRMGIDSLRNGLSSVFCAHIRTEFPAFNQQTRTKLAEKRAQLESLGPARSVLSEQREYLRSIVSSYQQPKFACLTDDYRSTKGFGQSSPPNLLRNIASYKKSQLRDPLETSGLVWRFQTPQSDVDLSSDEAACKTNYDSTKNIYSWINYRYQTTKARSLPGLVPYPLIERLFEEQTANWADITRSFINAVQQEFEAAVIYCLRSACQNQQILAELEKLVIRDVKQRLQSFLHYCITCLIKHEQNDMQVIASEKYFVRDIREARTTRYLSAIARLPFLHPLPKPTSSSGGLFGGGGSGSSMIASFQNTSVTTQSTPLKVLAAASEAASAAPTESLFEIMVKHHAEIQEVLTHERQIVYEIHDILKAYYSTSVQHYADSVCKNWLNQQFIEETMNLFSFAFVDSMADEEVKRISEEGPQDRRKRRELRDDIEKLEMAIRESEAILWEPSVSV